MNHKDLVNYPDEKGNTGGLISYVIGEDVYIEPVGTDEDVTEVIKELVERKGKITVSDVYEALGSCFISNLKNVRALERKAWDAVKTGVEKED